MKNLTENPAASSPAVTVVIPAYRCERHIAETLDSVFAQTFTDFEVVVVNDGSPETHEMERVLAPYYSRIKYVKQANSGAAIARNTGVRESAGQLLAFLDGDDVWHAEYLTEQVSFLRSRDLDMVYCDAELIGLNGPFGETFMQSAPSTGDVTALSLLDLRCNVITSGTVIRRDAFLAAGGFEDESVPAEDFHLWVRVAHSGGRIGFQERVLLSYRVSDGGLSGGEVSRVERAIAVFRRLKRDVALSAAETAVLDRRLEGFKVDLAIALGKSHLRNGSNAKAAKEFAKAASARPTAKASAAAVLSIVAPGILRRSLKTNAFDGTQSGKSNNAPRVRKETS
jgi:hypothetical protein